MSLFEKIKNIRRSNLQEKKIKFPGGTGDIGFTAPKRGEKVQKRLDRADKLGTPDPFDADYDKKVKKVDKRTKIGKAFQTPKKSDLKKLDKQPGGYRAPKSEFGPGITKGQANVKEIERRAFKITKPSDIKLPKSFTDFQKNLQDYKDRDLPGGPRKSSTKSKTSGTPLTRQDVGMAPPDKPKTKGVKQSEVSKKAKDFTKQINQNRTSSGIPMRKGATTIPKDTAKDIQISKMKERIKELGGQREKLSSATGKKDVPTIRKVNKEIGQLTKSMKSNPFAPTVYNKNTAGTTSGAKKVPNTFKTFPTAGGNKVTQSTRSLTTKNKGSVKYNPPSKGVSSPPLSPKGKKFVSRIPKFLKKSKTLTSIGKAAVKNPYVASAVGVGLAAAGAYAGYKAFQNRQKKKQTLTYKDFKSLSTPSDPDKGKIIHTRDIPKMNIKKGDVAKFPSPNKIPKSTSAEFKSNYAYK